MVFRSCTAFGLALVLQLENKARLFSIYYLVKLRLLTKEIQLLDLNFYVKVHVYHHHSASLLWLIKEPTIFSLRNKESPNIIVKKAHSCQKHKVQSSPLSLCISITSVIYSFNICVALTMFWILFSYWN